MRKFNQLAAEGSIAALLSAIGEDTDREGLRDTPKRVAKAFAHWTKGMWEDPAEHLKVTFSKGNYNQLITLLHIEFYSMCEHHMAPFFGSIHIGYIPNRKVVGLSKLARVADIYSRRLQIQEQLTDQIADAISKHLKPKGCIVAIDAKHMCVCSRGVGKQRSIMTTTALRGIFRKESRAVDEFLGTVARTKS